MAKDNRITALYERLSRDDEMQGESTPGLLKQRGVNPSWLHSATCRRRQPSPPRRAHDCRRQ